VDVIEVASFTISRTSSQCHLARIDSKVLGEGAHTRYNLGAGDGRLNPIKLYTRERCIELQGDYVEK